MAAAGGSKKEIGIIGAACRFPGGVKSLEDFWRLLSKGDHAITEVDPSRWKRGEPIVAEDDNGKKSATRGDEGEGDAAADFRVRAGVLDHPNYFDSGYFGINDCDAAAMDPHHRLALEVAAETFHNAGLTKDNLKDQRVGVIVAMDNNDWIYLNPGDVGSLITPSSHAAQHISRFYQLRGPSMVMNTGCSSGITSIEQAMGHLRSNTCTMALVIGVHVLLGPRTYHAWKDLKLLSESGRGAVLGPKSDGFVLGEGCAGILLEVIPQARANGHKILAKIPAVTMGYVDPSLECAVDVLMQQLKHVAEMARNEAGLDPQNNQVAYAELSCVGRKESDLAEACALADIYGGPAAEPMVIDDDQGEGSADQPTRLVVGCVKPSIGYLEAASGMASLLKALLVLQHRQTPKQPRLSKGPDIDIVRQGILVPTITERIPLTTSSQPLRAVINSISFSGNIAHIILEEYKDPEDGEEEGNHHGLPPLVFDKKPFTWWYDPFPPLPEDIHSSDEDEENEMDEEGETDPDSDASGQPSTKRRKVEKAARLAEKAARLAEKSARLAQVREQKRDAIKEHLKGYSKRSRRDHDLPPFVEAVKAVNYEAVEMWIDHGYAVLGEGVLEAVKTGNQSLVKLIMDRGQGRTHCFARMTTDDRRNAGLFESLKGAGILHVAVLNNDPSMIELIGPYLITQHKNENTGRAWNAGALCYDNCKYTPLHYAVRNNKWKCIAPLIKSVRHRFDDLDKSGTPPLLWAQTDGAEVLKELLANGADINIMDRKGLSLLYWSVFYHGARDVHPNRHAEFSIHLVRHGANYGKAMHTSCRSDISLGCEGGEEDSRWKIPITVTREEYEAAAGAAPSGAGRQDRDFEGKRKDKKAETGDPASERPPYPLFAYMKDYVGCNMTNDKGCDCAGGCSTNPNCKCRLRNQDNTSPYNAEGLFKGMRTSVCECGPRCRCQGQCGLRQTARSVNKSVEIRWAGLKGWGVFTRENIKAGEYVMSYIGEYLTVHDAQVRLQHYEKSGFNVNYQVEVTGNFSKTFFIDASYGGNVSRLINHCCTPNLVMKKVVLFGVNYERAAFFAQEDIPEGSELTFDYDPQKQRKRRDSYGGQRCLCGSEQCRTIM